ncbi:MAG: hypothetical protein WCX46_03705 [Candidatus Paceibacterota bacterium]|jgi:DNA-directed RNA polymerase sigma subunit (sigma70/sigma32)
MENENFLKYENIEDDIEKKLKELQEALDLVNFDLKTYFDTPEDDETDKAFLDSMKDEKEKYYDLKSRRKILKEKIKKYQKINLGKKN